MDQQRRTDPDDKRTDPPSEGVRIIGAEEAAEALERGDIAPRRPDDEPRYGDRPHSPVGDGPRPVLRFPLGSSSDPRDIERPAVVPHEPISEPVELPHWTEPPTGQVPQILPESSDEPADGLDDWASFASSTPRWRDDSTRQEREDGFEDVAAWGADDGEDDDRLGALDDRERPSHEDYFSFADLDETSATGASVFAPDDETGFGADWPDDVDVIDEDPYEDDDLVPARRERPRRAGRTATGEHRPARAGHGDGGDRDMGVAVAVGVGLLAAALILFKMGPAPAMLLVTAVVALAVAELYGVLRQVGYQPVALAGIVGTVGLMVGAYNYGPSGIVTVLFLTTVVCLLWYLVGAAEEAPVMNIGVTLLGVLWVGLFGSFAALMLGLGDAGLGILLAAILGTVGYDVGGLFVGKNAGRQPLSAVSPNKTVEGLLGGCAVAFVVVILLTTLVGFGPIDSLAEGALVGLVIAIAAPLGDLCESLVKRDLAIKDMGSILPGHGGLLDRFDGLLFVLPAVWLLATVKDFFI